MIKVVLSWGVVSIMKFLSWVFPTDPPGVMNLGATLLTLITRHSSPRSRIATVPCIRTENRVWVQCLVLHSNGKPSTVDASAAFFLHVLLPFQDQVAEGTACAEGPCAVLPSRGAVEVLPWHAEVPRPGMESKPQQWQWRILNPVSNQGTPHCKLFYCDFLQIKYIRRYFFLPRNNLN